MAWAGDRSIFQPVADDDDCSAWAPAAQSCPSPDRSSQQLRYGRERLAAVFIPSA
jgi:hypothetical protein